MPEPEVGQWVRVTTGQQKGSEGVVDLITDFAVGRRFRVTHPHEKVCHGRFPLDHLRVIRAPEYQSKVDPATRQRALDLMMKGAPS